MLPAGRSNRPATGGQGAVHPMVVVGGSSGLGSAIADALAHAGHPVVTTHRDHDPGTATSLHCDVTDTASVEQMGAAVLERWGTPSAVVVAAGIGHRDLTHRLPDATFDEVLDTNLRGAFVVARTFLPSMLARRQGSLLFVASASGMWGTAGLAAYAASKTGLIGLARSIARESGRRGVRANVLAPGLLDNAVDRAPGVEAWLAATPAGRPGTVEECAAVARFLVSPASQAITGAVVPVDGGFGIGVA